MRIFWPAALLLCGFRATGLPEKTFTFNFHQAPLTKALDYYSAQTGQKFVIDPTLAASAKVTILQPKKVDKTEAFNLLSAAMALDGVAISNRDGTFVLASPRNMERSFIPVVNELPPLQPEKLITWVINLKNVDASSTVQQLRILTSKDGEVVSFGANRLVITDWVSNLYRVRDLLTQLDKPSELKAAAPAPEGKTTNQ